MQFGEIKKVLQRQSKLTPRGAEPAPAEQDAPGRALVALSPAAISVSKSIHSPF